MNAYEKKIHLLLNGKAIICTLYFLSAFLQLKAQHDKVKIIVNNNYFSNAGVKSKIFSSECLKLAVTQKDKISYLTNIKSIGKKHQYGIEVDSIKLNKTALKYKDTMRYTNVDFSLNKSPLNLMLSTNFQANVFNGGAPPDNTVAISNNGNIVSLINCSVAYYNTQGNRLYIGSFWELFNDPSLTELIYDPIVMYDSQSDRFVMIAVHGFTSVTSKLIICFSKSNNPLDGWYIYNLPGNPRNNGCWLDYPKLGISNNEVFITGNLFNDNTGFRESVIYQIEKNNGFEGLSLNWQLWSNLSGAPSTLIPVSYGQQGNYGPGLYFVNQSPGRGNAVQLYEITDSLQGNPQVERRIIFKSDYEPSGNALQKGSPVNLITSDCRILSAFYLNGIIHYVFQSAYQNSNYSGINYNRLNLNTLENTTYTYGELGYDCAYPTVASWAISEDDKSVVFCFLRSGISIFPETRAIVFSDNEVWSNSILIKAGVNFVDAFEVDNSARWGDYTGLAYKQNLNNREVWVSGCFGSTQNLFSTNYNCFNNWIAKIEDLTLQTKQIQGNHFSDINIFPNPVIDFFSIEFNLEKTGIVKVEIADLHGEISQCLFNGHAKSGRNILAFNKNALSSGTYFLTIKTFDKTIIVKKMIIQ